MDFRPRAVHPRAAEPGPPQGDVALPSPVLGIVIATPNRETDCGRTLRFPFPEKFIQLLRSECADCAWRYCALDVETKIVRRIEDVGPHLSDLILEAQVL